MLLERQEALRQLGTALDLATGESGRFALISGEAGIGKTSLLEAFAGSLPLDTPVYWGGCEALFAARPLGPLFDIAEQLDPDFAQLLQTGAENHRIYSEFLARAEEPARAGSVFIIEDIHWADNATMDFLKFVGRRVHRSRCLLLASYRDDEVGASHPLHYVLGELPKRSTDRMHLESLSRDAIAAIGQCDNRKAQEVLEITGGNPFFVRELFSSTDSRVPATVAEAILAKAARLSAAARRMLNLVSVVPGKCELRYLEAAFDNAFDLLDECAELGLLSIEREFVAFTHELARLAVEDTMPAGQRSKWNAHMLDALRHDQPHASARLAHHADMSGNQDAVLEHAPLAAAAAAKLGAHREAVALYRQALNNADTLTDLERAELLEHLSYELYVTGNIEDAITARRKCLSLWKELGDELQVAKSHRWLSRLYWFIGKRKEADRFADDALNLDARHQRSNEYAMACSNRAQLHMLSGEVEKAQAWATRAIELAELNDNVETLAHALNNLGTVLDIRSLEEGTPHLLRSLRLSLENNLQEHVARAYTNLSSTLVSGKRYAEAEEYLNAGIDYTVERDLGSWSWYMQGWRARLRLETGDWRGAADDALAVKRSSRSAALINSPALTTLARLYVRRGDPEATSAIDAAYAAIADTDELQRIGPLVAARAEHAWLHGRQPDDRDRLIATRDWAARLELAWFAAELTFWARQLGIDTSVPDNLPEPYDRLLQHGDWGGAARAWERIGCPYEAALALGTGDDDARKKAVAIFTELGAEPAAARLRKALRDKGVKDLPKVARQSTKSNPAGLTNRQLDVLAALADGLSDVEIAALLFISPRTASHHVSAILGKLGAKSRTEAAARAHEMGIGNRN